MRGQILQHVVDPRLQAKLEMQTKQNANEATEPIVLLFFCFILLILV